MGPYEIASLYFILPIIVVSVWVMRRYTAAVVPEPEFEAWCRDARPVVFALRFREGGASSAAPHFKKAFASSVVHEHHRGRFPWSQYLFSLDLEIDEKREAIIARVKRSTVRRGAKNPELGATLDQLTTNAGENVCELWVHAELREEDEATGDERKDRGWLATVERGITGNFAPTNGVPDWAR